MHLFYEGTDVTRYVDIVKCIHRDVAGGRCDNVEIEMENAGAWFRWKPQCDDKIQVQMDDYHTGTMFLSSILPQNGRFRVIASSLPSAARKSIRYATYSGMRIADIMESCAGECEMRSALYGIDEDVAYPFLTRNKESAPAFLSRILRWEGAVLKVYDGRLIGISVRYAQSLSASQTLSIKANQQGVEYVKRDDAKWAGVSIKTPYATGFADDKSAPYGRTERLSDELPAMDNAQASRWAQGILLCQNRQAEELFISMEFNPNLSAMTRIDVLSETDMFGQWLIEEAEHDLFKRQSRIKLLRCIDLGR